MDDNSAVWQEFKELTERYDCISLGEGAPAASPPAFLVENLKQAILEGHNQYSRSAGHPLLVQKVSEFYGKMLGVSIDPLTGVVVSAGAYNVIANTLQALINPGVGEEVLVFEPGWPCYADFIQYAGGVYKPLSLELREGEWHFNVE